MGERNAGHRIYTIRAQRTAGFRATRHPYRVRAVAWVARSNPPSASDPHLVRGGRAAARGLNPHPLRRRGLGTRSDGTRRLRGDGTGVEPKRSGVSRARDSAIPEPPTAEQVTSHYAKRVAQELKLPSLFAAPAPQSWRRPPDDLRQRCSYVKAGLVLSVLKSMRASWRLRQRIASPRLLPSAFCVRGRRGGPAAGFGARRAGRVGRRRVERHGQMR